MVQKHAAWAAVAAALVAGLPGCGGESQRTSGGTGATSGSDPTTGGTDASGGTGGSAGVGASGGTGGTISVDKECPRDSEGRVVLPLNRQCDIGCPRSVEEALQALAQWACGDRLGDVTVTTGCGTVTVTGSTRVSASGYYYDEASGALLGAFSGSDVPSGTCNSYQYYYGAVPGPCETATTEYFCATGGDEPPDADP